MKCSFSFFFFIDQCSIFATTILLVLSLLPIIYIQQKYLCQQRWARYFFIVAAVPVFGALLKVPAGTGTRYLKLKVPRYFCRYFLKKFQKESTVLYFAEF